VVLPDVGFGTIQGLEKSALSSVFFEDSVLADFEAWLRVLDQEVVTAATITGIVKRRALLRRARLARPRRR
jgi:hypothetical protein